MDEFKQNLYLKTQTRNLIFSSVDRNHIISGLKNKLLAYLQCLDNFPRIRNKVCLVQYADPYECPTCFLSECSHDHKERKEFLALVQQINTKYKGSLIYVEEALPQNERIALWSASNFLLVTTLRDGQSLLPLEFIAVKQSEGKRDKL